MCDYTMSYIYKIRANLPSEEKIAVVYRNCKDFRKREKYSDMI